MSNKTRTLGMPNVVRNVGTLKNARNVDGEMVYREERIFLKSYNQSCACLPTDNHFIYKSRRIGSSTLCTCGSACITVGYSQYKKYSSYIGNEVLACQHLMQYGFHADGST